MNMTDTNNVALGLCIDGSQAAAGAAGIYDGAKLHLTKALVAVGKNANLADLVAAECSYGGYAAQTLVFPPVGKVAADGNVELVAGALTFAATDTVTPQSAYCAFVTNTAGTVLLSSGQFDSALNFQDTLHEAILSFRWRPQSVSLMDVIA